MSDTAAEPENQNLCYRCGARLGFTRFGTSEGIQSGWSCWRCGYFEQYEERPAPRRQFQKNQNVLIPCSVVGCGNMVLLSTTITGMCHRCNRLMAGWEKSAKTKPAPIILVAGEWVFNPERQKRKETL